MSTRADLLKLLSNNTGSFVSGQKIGESLKVSRNSIWKAVEQLRREGYEIDSRPRVGYCLKSDTNIISRDSLAGFLKHRCDLWLFDSVDSTNNVAKEILAESGIDSGKPAVIIAERQTVGRGRLGRSFESPAGSGIYLTIALKPDFDLAKSLNVTMATAVATCRAIEKAVPLRPKIKWVNDIFIGGKKVCGILTEAQSNFETGEIDSLIIGIGVNCFPGNISPELEDTIGFLSEDFGSFSRSELAAGIIDETLTAVENLHSEDFLREYRSKCFILGKDITVYPAAGAPGVKARAIDIDSCGGLVVEYMEGRLYRQMNTLTAGEVSIRI